MTHVLRIGVPDQIAYFRVFNDDGSAKTDFSSATAGASLSVFRTGLSSISIAVLSNKAADNTSHADGAIRSVGGNLYTVDLPDSAAASYCPSIGVRGVFTGGVIEPVPHPLVGYAPETLLTDIFGLVEDVAVLAKSTVSSGNVFQVQIDSPTGVFASHPALQDCLLEIKDVSSGVTCYRWITTHSGVGGAGGVILYFETSIPFFPVAGDLLRVFRAARFTSNVNKWLGSNPGVLVGDKVPAYDADAQTLLGDIPTVAEFNARTLPAANYFDPATDAASLQPDQGVNIVKVAGATAIAEYSVVNFPQAIGTSFLSPVNVGQVLMDYGTAKTSDVTAIPAAVWSHGSRTLSAFGFSVTVGTNNDKTGYSLTQGFPSNFASLGINPSGHVSRVTLVDTTTANTDMRGTDSALLAANYIAPANSDIAAIKAKTDNLPANPAAVGDVSPTINFSPTIEPTTLDSTERGAIAAAVRSELNMELGRIDVAISTRSTYAGGAVASVTAPVTVGTNNDKTGYSLSQAFPSNFASLGINPSGHVSRVTLVDTTTTNTDMRGTNNSLLAANYTAPANSDIAAIKAKTDNLPTDPAASSDVSPTINFSPTIEPTTLDATERGAIAAAVRSELNTELGRIDVAISTRSTYAGGAVASVTAPVTVGTNNDKAGYSLTQAFPSNFASLGINPSGHVSRVTLVDTTTVNADMRGTDSALLAANYTPPPTEFEGATAAEIWQYADRTLTSAQAEIEVDVEALAEEIAEALTSSGLYRLTIEAVDQNSEAVPGLRLQIVGVAGTTRTIGSDGKTTIDLDPGTYTLRVTPPTGYAPVPDREIVITSADVTEPLELTSLIPAIIPPVGTCALTIQVADQSGVPLEGVPVSGKLPKGYLVNLDTLNLNTLTHQTTDPQGLATLILIRDQPYDLTAQRPDRCVVTLRIQVPDAEQATLSQVIQV